MSRRFALGAVAVLIVFLALVSQAVNPIRPSSKPAMTAQERQLMFEQTEEQRKLDEKKQIADTLAHERKFQKEHPYKDTMTDGWYRERSDGNDGLRHLQEPGK